MPRKKPGAKPKPRKVSAPTQERLNRTGLQASVAALDRIRDTLETQIAHIEKDLAASRERGEVDIKLGSHAAYLSKHLASVTNEYRQLEKHDVHTARSLSPDQVEKAILQQLREAPVDMRKRILGQFGVEVGEGSVL